jgi:tetratricopeptide (TPR) repeat protein
MKYRRLKIILIPIVLLIPSSLGADGHLDKGIRLLQDGHLEEARLFFEERTREDRQDAEALHYLCRIFFRLRKYDHAIDCCQRAVDMSKDVAEYHFWLGKAMGMKARDAGILQQARLARRIIGEFQKTIELDPSHIGGHVAAANFYLRAPPFMGGGIEKAKKEAKTLMSLDLREGRNILIRIHEKEGHYHLAEREYEKLERHYADSQNNHNFYNRYGYCLLSQKKYDAAVEKFRQQVELAPDDANSHSCLGDGLRAAGRLEEALSEYKRAIDIDPEFHDARRKYETLLKILAKPRDGGEP